MAREFNPDLFGAPNRPPAQNETFQLDAQKRKIRELEAMVHTLAQKVDKLTLTIEQKTVQLQHALRSLETNSKSAVQELAKNQSSLVQKVTERRMADAKMQELIDRHNQLVHSFEVRMNSMQKLTNEQEIKLMSYQANMEELLREVRNMKR